MPPRIHRKEGVSVASFSNQTKTEICGEIHTKEQKFAFLYGALLSARQLHSNSIILQTECEAFANLFQSAVRTVCSKAVFDTEFRSREKKLPLWIFSCTDQTAIAALLDTFQIVLPNRTANLSLMKSTAFSAFAAGIFVTNGSVASPDKDYHLEIVFPDASLCDLIGLLLANIGIEAKTITRKHDHVLYLKQNEKISDALTYFGAQNAALELIQAQVYKSFRSQTNRRTNCDLANIEKSLAAGEQQIADIRFLIEHIGLDELPENLRTVAVARLEAPEATLRDLGQMLNPPISRSGVHHRLRKLAEMAEELRNHP